MAFLCGGGFPPPASLGQDSLGAPLQQFPPRPLPLPRKGLHRTRERAGERGGSPVLPSARGGGDRREGAAGGGGMGGAGAGNDRRAPSRRPGIPPQALRKTRKAVPQPPSPPSALPRRPVIALESCPAGAHLPDGNLTLPASSLPLAPAC